MEKKCLDCKVPARWVDNGREIGAYYWCDSCKKEEKEWKAIELPTLEDPPRDPGYMIWSPCLSIDTHKIWKDIP